MPVVITPATVADALLTVKATVSGLGTVLSAKVVPATVPLATVSIKLASVAGVAFT